MLADPQASWAVATPVLFVVVSAGHSNTTFVGQVIVGGFVSVTVIVCNALVLLPQASVAVQVRAMTLVAPQLVVTTSLKLMAIALQVSWAMAIPVLFVLVSAGHSKTMFSGRVRAGAVLSWTVLV